MAHHSQESWFSDMLKSQKAELEGLGATGQFPDGKLSSHDEGEIKFAIAADPSRHVVLIDFGKPIRSLGLTPDQAVEIADMLTKKAWELRGIV